MSTIQIQQLPEASLPLNQGAYGIIKDPASGTDKKVTVRNLQNINISNFLSMTSTPNSTDVLAVTRPALNTTYAVPFSNIGFVAGTKMWFYQAAAPAGWQIMPQTNDAVLGVWDPNDGSVYKYPGQITGNGSSTRPDHVPDNMIPYHTLIISEMPSHNHSLKWSKELETNQHLNTGGPPPGKNRQSTFFPDDVVTYTGGDGAHTHGDSFRPIAAVGILCIKQ